MSMITILVPAPAADDPGKEREHDLVFELTRRGSASRRAEFYIRTATDDGAKLVPPGSIEFEMVARQAYDCYYEKMLAAVKEGE